MPIQNQDVAERFERVADLLEIQDANPFRVRAYRQAARSLRSLSRPVRELVEEGEDLSELPSIGDSLADKIEEVVRTRRLSMLDELGRGTPESLARLLEIRGVGPKRARALHEELGVRSLGELREAAEQGEVRELKGFGARTEERILTGIEALGRKDGAEERRLRSLVEPVVGELEKHLSGSSHVERVVTAGSYRRHRPTVGDLDVLVTGDDGAAIARRLTSHEDVEEVAEQGEGRASVVLRTGLRVDLRVVPGPSFGAALVYFTGSKAHGIALRRRAQARDLKLNEYGVFRQETGGRLAGATEEDVYAALELPWIPPELREDRGELEAAEAGELPPRLELAHIRGDLHAHSRASDGKHSLRQMADRARELGREYLAITDHSVSTRVAGGLTVEEMHRHLDRIEALDDELDDLTLLRSAEVDIREDGRLDYPAELLDRLDLAVCAVHAGFDLSRRRQTDRIRRAMDDPHFSVLAHPTGRRLGTRPAYELDLEAILEAARERGCFVELDCQAERMDLRAQHLKRARELGVRVSVATDAHDREQLSAMERGVGMARRGWLGPDDVLNTRPLDELRELLCRG